MGDDMVEEKTFEEQFPSLKDKTGYDDHTWGGVWKKVTTQEWIEGGENRAYVEQELRVPLNDIKKCCLDKQQVRDAIEKTKNKDIDYEKGETFSEELIKELGL